MSRCDEVMATRRGLRAVHWGRTVIAAVVLAVCAWIASGFILWKQCRISLPHKFGSIVYMARLSKIPSAEWQRKVRIETKRIRGVERWIPGDPSGAFPVNVYWYPPLGKEGPYLRFHDPDWEYLVDLRRGTTLLIQRHADGSVHAGPILSAWPHMRSIEDPATGEIVDTVDGRPVRKLEGHVASRPGVYLGRIEYPFNSFVPRASAPEEALPKRGSRYQPMRT